MLQVIFIYLFYFINIIYGDKSKPNKSLRVIRNLRRKILIIVATNNPSETNQNQLLNAMIL